MGAAARLHLHGQLARALLRRLHAGARRRQLRPHALALLLELDPLRLQRRQRIDGRLHAGACGPQLGLGAFELGAHVRDAALQLTASGARCPPARASAESCSARRSTYSRCSRFTSAWNRSRRSS